MQTKLIFSISGENHDLSDRSLFFSGPSWNQLKEFAAENVLKQGYPCDIEFDFWAAPHGFTGVAFVVDYKFFIQQIDM